MNSLSIDYAVVWELNFATEYKWSRCGKCFNSKTGRVLKQVYKSRCIGYNIRGKFYSLTKLRKHLIKIKDVECPF